MRHLQSISVKGPWIMLGGKKGKLNLSHLNLNATNATMRHANEAKDLSNVNIGIAICPKLGDFSAAIILNEGQSSGGVYPRLKGAECQKNRSD